MDSPPERSAEQRIPVVNLKAENDAIRGEIDAAVRRVLDRGDFILGEEVEEFERRMAQLHGCAHGIACGSGSDALLLSLIALGVAPGDAVLVPSFTFFATAGAVARLGAQPVFVDIDPRTFNISVEAAERALKTQASPTRVKAVIPVHLYGQCADMEPLLALAKQYRLAVIEDAAQAVLGRYSGRAAGSMGAAGCFSFYPTKNLGASGDGGMITTNDTDLVARFRLLRNHGTTDKRTFSLLGVNSRMDTLQAAILLVKLQHLEEWTRRRQQQAAFYREAFLQAGAAAPNATYPSAEHPIVLPYAAAQCEHVYHQFTIRAHGRDDLALHLDARGIGTAIHYAAPLHRQPVFAHLPPAACAEADRASAEVLCLPIYPQLTEAMQSRVVNEIIAFYA
jgi:dTDP-4-amino-4,6-dideoxygalactose transaminase